jgi:uncharacterized protein
MKKIFNIIILNLSILLLLWFNFALNVPKSDWYVLDQANILTQKQEQILEETIFNVRQATDVEMWILIINSLEWEDIFNYSLNVTETRWIGDKEKDNGLLMLFTMNDRERRIQVWYGLEWIITDSIAKRFWEKNITNDFRNWLYFNWINNTLKDIINYINKDAESLAYINANTNNINNSDNNQESNNNSNRYFFWFISLIFVIKSLVLKYNKKTKKSKIRKWWRIILLILWAIMWFLAYIFILPWQLIRSWMLWYGMSMIWLFIWMLIGDWSTLLWIMLLWWRGWRWWSSGGFWGGSFWWFWGGGFGWWWGGWKR